MLHVDVFLQVSAILAPECVFGYGYSQEKRPYACVWHSCMGAYAGLPDAMHHLAIHLSTTKQPSSSLVAPDRTHSGAMSTISDSHIDDPEFVGGYAEDRTQTDAKDSVILHQLCDRCKSFVDGWNFLRWVKDGIDDIHDVRDEYPNPAHFSTVAQLLQSKDACHLCAMVLSILDYHKLDHNGPVEFMICKDRTRKPPGHLPLILGLGGTKYVQYRWASMYLKCFDGKQVFPNF